MLGFEKENKIRIELMYIFLHLIVFADKKLAFSLINEAKILERCRDFLEIEDVDLNHICLEFITKVIEVGNHFTDDLEEKNEQRGNYFINYIRNIDLRTSIVEKSYSEDKDISKLSSEI